MNEFKNIVFIAEMRNPRTFASSTQIMTRNLLQGFSALSCKTVFVAVIADDNDREDIKNYYKPFCTKLFFSKHIISHIKSNNKMNLLRQQIAGLYHSMVLPKVMIPEGLLDEIDDETLLISQSPPIDTALLSISIKKTLPNIQYIQYWGDPLALSLITPEEYGVKRFLLKEIEKKLHCCADRIVYGTKSLFDSELTLFPEIEGKADYARVSYIPEAFYNGQSSSNLLYGYFGNYYSYIRNINPLIRAFKNMSDTKLVICGSSDLKYESIDNIEFKNRVPQFEVEYEEAKIDVEICILNKVGVQIPGKLFYHTNLDKHILVLLDGPRKESILEELLYSKRFIFCNNNVEEIEHSIKSINSGAFSLKDYNKNYYSPVNACSDIIFGHG